MDTRVRSGSVAVLAALLVVLTGCGSQEPKVKLGGDAASGSATPSPSSTPSAQPPQAAPQPAQDTTAGRMAFARWFARALDYSYATNDVAPVSAVASSQPLCKTCQEFGDHLDQQKKAGLRLVDSHFVVTRALQTAKPSTNIYIIDLLCSSPAYTKVDRGGKVVTHYPAQKHVTLEVGVAWTPDGYRVTGWRTDS